MPLTTWSRYRNPRTYMTDEYGIAASIEREILDNMFGGRRLFHLPMFEGENAEEYFAEFEFKCDAEGVSGERAKALFYCLCHWDIQVFVMDVLSITWASSYERFKAEILLCSWGASRGGLRSIPGIGPWNISDFIFEENEPLVWRMRCVLFWRQLELKTRGTHMNGTVRISWGTGSCNLPVLT